MSEEPLKKKSEAEVDRLKRAKSLLELLRLDEATGEEKAELDSLLLQDDLVREHVATELQDEALLRYELRLEAAALHFKSAPPELWDGSDEALSVTETPDGSPASSSTSHTGRVRRSSDQRPFLSRDGWLGRAIAIAPSVLLLAIGYVAALLVARPASDPAVGRSEAGSPPSSNASESIDEERLVYVGYVSEENGGLWSIPDSRRVESGFGLQAGDTIRLTSGLGQLEFSGGMSLGVEGPAEFAIQSNGIPSLNYGRTSARIPWGSEAIELSTPLGTLRLDGGTSAGIASFGSELQVHVFKGRVRVVLPNAESGSDTITLEAGQARLVDVSHDYRFRVLHRPLSPDMFASRLSMDTDRLSIGQGYIDQVLKSQPVAYWRFEQEVNGVLPNQVANRHHLRVSGNPVVVEQADNHALQFGFGSMAGILLSDDTFDELCQDSYSIELWLKPAHFHNGAFVNLIAEDPNSASVKHALLLECRGPYLANESRSNALRFLHRSPPGIADGTECFSSANYAARRWQHVVAAKDGTKMRLFINGDVTAIGEDETTCTGPLRLLVGQLYPSERMRPFVGQMDELAVYGHALTAEEIKAHYLAAQD